MDKKLIMYAAIVVIVVSAISLFFILQPRDQCQKYTDLTKGYRWGFQTEACEEKLSNVEELQKCYSCVYNDMIHSYGQAKWLVEGGYEKLNFCSKLEDTGEGGLKDQCFMTMSVYNLSSLT